MNEFENKGFFDKESEPVIIPQIPKAEEQPGAESVSYTWNSDDFQSVKAPCTALEVIKPLKAKKSKGFKRIDLCIAAFETRADSVN